MGELRRFIKSNNLIMRITSLLLTVAILASALVYFSDEKMESVSAEGEVNRPYMEYIVQRLINGLQDEFNILEIVPYQGVGEFRYYAADKSVKKGLEKNQDALRDMYGKTHIFTNFSYTIAKDQATNTYSVDNPNTFTTYVMPEYKQLLDEVITVNTVEANKITEVDINKADLIIINTGTSDKNVIECYKTFYDKDKITAVYDKDGKEITDYTKITYNTFEKVKAEDVVDEGDVSVTTMKKIYYVNENKWPSVYAYYDTKTDGTSVAMPGIEMTLVKDNVYSIDIPSDAYNIGFTNGTKNHNVGPAKIQGYDKVYYGGNWYDYPLILNPSKYTVTMPTDKNIDVVGETEATQGAVYAVVLTPAKGYVVLDDTVVVTIGGVEYKDFAYDSKTGEIAIPSEAVTGNIVVNATAVEASTLKSYTVTLPTDTNIVSVGEATAMEGKLYNVTLSAKEGYTLPEKITVKVGDTEITNYTYAKETGDVVIPVSEVKGNIVITATATVVTKDEFAYVSRDMSWSMCEKLLEYMIKGRDLEISNGTVVSGVKTPVIIDNDGLDALNKDSNIYKLIYTYRMCDADRWDILKKYISTYNSDGVRYRTADGIITATLKKENTGLKTDAVVWETGKNNPIKALFDTVAPGGKTEEGVKLSSYYEDDPTKANHLSNDYWVYTNSSSSKNWTIPLYYNVEMKADSSYTDKVIRSGSGYKSIDILKYLLGVKSGTNWTQIYSFDTKLRVLEIQPCNSFEYNTLTKIKELGVALLRKDASKWKTIADSEKYLSIDYLTTNALNGIKDDIASNYDVVIIGDNTGLLTKDSSGKTIYNDRNLNGYIYLAFGDLYKISTNMLGFLPDEYMELTESQAYTSSWNGTTSLRKDADGNKLRNISVSHVWTPYVYSVLKNKKASGYYIVQDMYEYYSNKVSERKYNNKSLSSNKKIDNKSFYMDYYLGNTRLPDNDITEITKEKLREFVETGNPIIVADSVYTADRTKIYPTSSMYNFATKILRDESGNIRSNVVNKNISLGKSVAYLGAKAPEIKFKTGTIDVIKRTDTKDSEGNYIYEIEQKSNMEIKPVEPTYNNDLIVDSFNSKKLRYEFNIYGQVNATYNIKFFVDKNNDGVYKDDPENEEENEVYLSEIVTLTGSRTRGCEIDCELSKDFRGMLSWKIQVVQLDDKGKDTTYKVEEKGYSAIFRGDEKKYPLVITDDDLEEIDVLQIYPDANNLDMTKDPFTSLFNSIASSVGYKITVNKVSVTDFNKWYAEKPYVKGSETQGYKSDNDRLKKYEMLVFGFYDSFNHKDISNDYGAMDNIMDFIESDRAVLLTHDTLSWRSTPNYVSGYVSSSDNTFTFKNYTGMTGVNENGKKLDFSYDFKNTSPTLTFMLRDKAGMDKYGVTRIPSDRSDKDQPTYEAVDSNDKEYRPNYMETDSVRELQGFNSWMLWRVPFMFRHTNNQNGIGNNYYTLRPYSDDDYLYYTKDGGNTTTTDNWSSTKAVCVNEGAVTMFPYNIGDSLSINTTHGQYFELDMEDEEVVVWYNLAQNKENATDNSQFYGVTNGDAANNYYIYSKGNITYSGAGHEDMKKNPEKTKMEYKLFVNTIVKAIAGGNSKPEINLTNGSIVSEGKYLIYVDTSDSADRKSVV